jgi:hypothetical protein
VTIYEMVVLLYGAAGRVGPLTADLMIGPGQVDGGEGRWWQVRCRVTQDGPRYRWELIDQIGRPDRRSRTPAPMLVGDGDREWAVYPHHVVVRPYRRCLLAEQLLDPSWLLGRYDLAIAAEMSTADGRPAVSIAGRRKTVGRGGDGAPELVEAVVDAERGFLHRFTGIGKGVPVETIELRDLRLDTPIDDTACTVEPSEGLRWQDRTSARRHHLSRRVGRSGRPWVCDSASHRPCCPLRWVTPMRGSCR